MIKQNSWWQVWKRPITAAAIKEKRELLQEQIKLDKVKKKQSLIETSLGQDYFLSNYTDMLSRQTDGYISAYPATQPTDRRYGSNFPFWVSEMQLSMLRASARFCVTTSPNAQGLLNGLCSYVIGSGFNYRVAAKNKSGVKEKEIQAAQEVINKFIKDNNWMELEQEIFWRSREDGEAFLRYFPQADGSLFIRTVEPEQVYQPGGTDLNEWSYGIQTEIDDICEIKNYHIDYRASGGEEKQEGFTQGEIVPAEKIIHIKINVKRSIKRGLSDFAFETLDSFTQAGKLRKNLGEGAAVQAAIAAVRQHESSSIDQVTDFISDATDYSSTNIMGRQQDFQKIEAGSFLDIPKGMVYVPPPAALNSTAHLDIFSALLRTAGNRHNAPEWLVSSDSSNGNYASSLTAEAPFTRHCLRLQEFYKGHFEKVFTAVLATAAEAGILPKNILNIIVIQIKAPSVETRDKATEAQANQIYNTLGIKSKQTIAQEVGLDWDDEENNQHEAMSGGNADVLKMPDEQGQEMPQNGEQPQGEQVAQAPADTALNGAQIQSLVNVVTQCVQGMLPVSAGMAIAKSSFPLIPEEVIKEIFADIVVKPMPEKPKF